MAQAVAATVGTHERVATLLLFAVPRDLIGSSHWRKMLFFMPPHPQRGKWMKTARGDPALPKISHPRH